MLWSTASFICLFQSDIVAQSGWNRRNTRGVGALVVFILVDLRPRKALFDERLDDPVAFLTAQFKVIILVGTGNDFVNLIHMLRQTTINLEFCTFTTERTLDRLIIAKIVGVIILDVVSTGTL